MSASEKLLVNPIRFEISFPPWRDLTALKKGIVTISFTSTSGHFRLDCDGSIKQWSRYRNGTFSEQQL